MTDSERIPCPKCGGMMLPSTASANDGFCARCRRELNWAQEDAERNTAPESVTPPALPTPLDKYPCVPFKNWAKDPDDRWIDAGHTFGIHLMEHVRDQVLASIPADASESTRRAMVEASENTLHAFMSLLDGTCSCPTGEHEVEYALFARIRDESDELVEEIELAPDGDGLAMGLAGWWQNEFWKDKN